LQVPKVFTKRDKSGTSNVKSSATTANNNRSTPLPKSLKVLALAASTGGPQAFQEVLSCFPTNFPLPILCVQHISTGFLQGFINWLGQSCNLPVKLAHTGDSPERGIIYFPPERKHLQLDAQGRFYCAEGLPVDGHCPSATVLFQNVARLYGPSALGVLMSGMGRDGAAGLLTIYQRGGYTIAQDEATSIVFGMPQEAIKIGATKLVLGLPEIGPKILEIVNQAS